MEILPVPDVRAAFTRAVRILTAPSVAIVSSIAASQRRERRQRKAEYQRACRGIIVRRWDWRSSVRCAEGRRVRMLVRCVVDSRVVRAAGRFIASRSKA